MGAIFKTLFVTLVAGLVSACLAGVTVTAFGWPLFVAALIAGMGAGAAGLSYYKRVQTQ